MMNKALLLILPVTVFSFSVGYFISKKKYYKKIITAGKLITDNNEPNEPVKLFLELNSPVVDICNANVVQLEVVNQIIK